MRGGSEVLFGLAGVLALALAGPAAAQEDCAGRLDGIEETLAGADLPEEQRADVETILTGARDLAAAGEEEDCLQSADALDDLLSSLALTGEVEARPGEPATPGGEVEARPGEPAAPGGEEAANAPTPTGEERAAERPAGGSEAGAALTVAEAEEMIGREVVDRDGEPVGELVDVARLRGREQTFAVLRYGGLLGLGERDAMVMLDELERGEAGAMVLSRTAAGVLDELPEYDRATFESLTGRLD